MDKRKRINPCSVEGRLDYKTLFSAKDQPPDIPNLVSILRQYVYIYIYKSSIYFKIDACVDFSVPVQGLIALNMQIKAELLLLNEISSLLISKYRSPRGGKDGTKCNCYLLTLSNTLTYNQKYTVQYCPSLNKSSCQHQKGRDCEGSAGRQTQQTTH